MKHEELTGAQRNDMLIYRVIIVILAVITAIMAIVLCKQYVESKDQPREQYVLDTVIEYDYDTGDIEHGRVDFKEGMSDMISYYGFYSVNVPYEIRASENGPAILRLSFSAQTYPVYVMTIECLETGTKIIVGDTGDGKVAIDNTVGYDSEGREVRDSRYITRGQLSMLAYLLEHYNDDKSWHETTDEDGSVKKRFDPYDGLFEARPLTFDGGNTHYYQIS